MLIFNCSRAFADFIEGKKAGTTLVETPLSKDPADDARLLRDHDGKAPAHLWQWQVHMVTVRRRPCVLVMEHDSRYSMLFTRLKAGDMAGFVSQMLERLLKQQYTETLALGEPPLASIDEMAHRLMQQHSDFRFFLRSERSVQAHLNEVARGLADQAAASSSLPEGHEQCVMFDDHCNNFIRRSKTRPDWFYPQQVMLWRWLHDFGGYTEAGILRLQQQQQAQQRAFQSALLAEALAKAGH